MTEFNKDVVWTKEWKETVLEAIDNVMELTGFRCVCCVKAIEDDCSGEGPCSLCPIGPDGEGYCYEHMNDLRVRGVENLQDLRAAAIERKVEGEIPVVLETESRLKSEQMEKKDISEETF